MYAMIIHRFTRTTTHIAGRLSLIVIFCASVSFAGDFNVGQHSIAPPSVSFPSIESTEVLSSGRYAFRYSFFFENDPLILTDASGNSLLRVIDERYTSEISGAYGFPWFEVGGALPVIVQNSIGRPVIGVTHFTDRGIGDARFFARRSLFQFPSTGISIGASLHVTAPTSTVTFAGNSWPTTQPNFVFDWHSDYVHAAANAGVRVQKSATFANLETGTVLTYGAGLLLTTPWLKSVSLLGEIQGETSKFDFDKRHTPLVTRGGIKVAFGKSFELSAGYGRALTSGFGAADSAAFLTFTFRSKPKAEVPVYWTSEGIQIIGNQIVPNEEIRFAPESDELESGGDVILKAVAETIRKNSSMRLVHIEVYADSGESASTSLYLASRRAQVLFQKLVEHAIAGTRLTAKGLLPYQSANVSTSEERMVQFRFEPKDAASPNSPPVQKTAPEEVK